MMKLQLLNASEKIKEKTLVKITRNSGIPLVGALPFGVIDRGTNLLQVRATSLCNASCLFCSTDAGVYSTFHKTNYLVDVDYLLDWVKDIVKFKGGSVIIFLDSVGEPMSHPHFVSLVEKLHSITGVSEIITVTNGTFLTKEKIYALEKAGLTQINLSIHSLHPEKAKFLFGMPSYDVEKIKENIHHILNTKIKLIFTPVWIPEMNDRDIEEIILFAKNSQCGVGLQKYEVYKKSRKMKSVHPLTYWKFYKKLEEWEKKYDLPLTFHNDSLHIERRKKLPLVFDVGEKVNVEILCKGWFPKQMIGKAKNRCISITECFSRVGDRVNAKIVDNANNIYVAQLI